MHDFLKFIFGIEPYIFRTDFLYIIRSLVLCIQYDGQKTCPKYAEFYSKNKFKKSVHLFEVRHPGCVSQITKFYSRSLKVKTQLYYIYIADDGNS